MCGTTVRKEHVFRLRAVPQDQGIFYEFELKITGRTQKIHITEGCSVIKSLHFPCYLYKRSILALYKVNRHERRNGVSL